MWMSVPQSIILELNILKIESLISTLSNLILSTVPNSVNRTTILPVAESSKGFINSISPIHWFCLFNVFPNYSFLSISVTTILDQTTIISLLDCIGFLLNPLATLDFYPSTCQVHFHFVAKPFLLLKHSSYILPASTSQLRCYPPKSTSLTTQSRITPTLPPFSIPVPCIFPPYNSNDQYLKLACLFANYSCPPIDCELHWQQKSCSLHLKKCLAHNRCLINSWWMKKDKVNPER